MAAQLVGREPELAQVREFLTDGMGAPRALVLEGPPGIGKTTVWRESLRAADGAGMRVLASQPTQTEAVLPFAGLIDLLTTAVDDVLPELSAPQARALEVALLRADPVDAPGQRLLVSVAVMAALEGLARRRPLVVAVDDLQWLDDPSRRVLSFALRRLQSSPAVLIGTRRLLPRDAMNGLDRVLDEIPCHRVEVGPLPATALDVIVRERLGLALSPARARVLAERCDGNPLHALELGRLVRAGASLAPGEPGDIPSALRDLVDDRIRSLDARTRRALLELTALSRPSRRLFTNQQDELATADRAGLIEIHDDVLRFSHPLFASALYAGAPAEERRAAHRRLAGRIEDAAESALHLALATVQPDHRVAARLDDLAREVAARGAPDSAAELTRQARRLTPADHHDDLGRRGLAEADYLLAAGDGPGVRSILDDLVTTLPAGRWRAEARWRLADVSAADCDYASRTDLLETALREAGPEPGLRARIELEFAIFAANAGKGAEFLSHAGTAVSLAETTDDPALQADALSELGVAKFFRGEGVPDELMREALRRAPAGRPYYGESPRTKLGNLLTWAGRHGQARELLEADLTLARESGDLAAEWVAILHLVELECRAGEFVRADELARRGLDVSNHLMFSNAEPGSLWQAALVASYRGRIDEAREAGQAGLAAAGSMGDFLMQARIDLVLGFLALSLGDMAEATDVLAPLPARLRAAGILDPGVVPALPLAAEALVGAGRLADAEMLIGELAEFGRAADRPWARATAARCRALHDAATGDLRGALAAVADAYPDLATLGDPFEQARTLLVEGTLLRRAKKRAAARRTLETALVTFEELGTPLWAARAESEIARLGLRPSPSVLTEAETRVCELAAAGATNREIAAELFISVKTVEANLSRVYRKLGVRSRVELAGRQHAIVPGRVGAGHPSSDVS